MLLIVIAIAAAALAFFGAYLSYCKSESSAFLFFMSLTSLAMGLLWAILVRQLSGNKSAIMAASLIWDIAVVVIYGVFPLFLSYRPNGWLVAGFVFGLLSITCLQFGVER